MTRSTRVKLSRRMARAGASTSSTASPGPAPAACSAQCYPGVVPSNSLVTESA